MKSASKPIVMILFVLFLLFSFSFVGCTKHPNAEQLQALQEQKNAALSAEKTLDAKRQERNELQSELQKKKQELADTQAELEKVKQRLAERANMENQNPGNK